MSSSGLLTLLLLLVGSGDLNLVISVACFGKKGGMFSLLSSWLRKRTAIGKGYRERGGGEMGEAWLGIHNGGILEGGNFKTKFWSGFVFGEIVNLILAFRRWREGKLFGKFRFGLWDVFFFSFYKIFYW